MVLLALLCAGAGSLRAQPGGAADALRAQFATVRNEGVGQIVDRPVYLQSTESADRAQGDVFAIIDSPYETLRLSLTRADRWCSILILHLNVKYCRAAGVDPRQVLLTGVGRKVEQPLSDVYWVKFDYHVATATPSYLNVALQAPSGPMNTRDYRIVAEATPFTDRQSLLHMSYSYGYGLAGRLAMSTYLATVGRAKTGFSAAVRGGDGQPVRVGGVRGLLERNTMRYYLAVESYLGAAALPADQQMAASLQNWFSATERYPQQLHEVERDAYVEMKLHEVQRQQNELPPVPEH